MEVSLGSDTPKAYVLPLSMRELGHALERMALSMAQAEREAGGSGKNLTLVELNLLDDTGIAALNLDFLGVEGPTNVLSFPGQGGVGSLALSVETIMREAWLYGQNPAEYIIKMLAHGLAHLMGYDHGAEMDKLVEKGLASVADRPD